MKTIIKETPKAEIRALAPNKEKLPKSSKKRVPYHTKIIQYGEFPDMFKTEQKQQKLDRNQLNQMQAMWKNTPSYPL